MDVTARACGRRYRPRRYSWTILITTDPSPTAAATCFSELARTWPAAKTPGRLDSKGNGGRAGAGPRAGEVRARQATPGADVAARVALQHAGQPLRARLAADQDEEGGCGDRLPVA